MKKDSKTFLHTLKMESMKICQVWVIIIFQHLSSMYLKKTFLGLPSDYKVASVKYKKESLANPQIKLFNASTFSGIQRGIGRASKRLKIFSDVSESSWVTDGDTKFKSLDAGVAGVWAVKVDLTVVFRENTGRDNQGPGSAWSVVPGGKMRWVGISWPALLQAYTNSNLNHI